MKLVYCKYYFFNLRLVGLSQQYIYVDLVKKDPKTNLVYLHDTSSKQTQS